MIKTDDIVESFVKKWGESALTPDVNHGIEFTVEFLNKQSQQSEGHEKKPAIEELEAILDQEEDVHIEILPTGEIREIREKGTSSLGHIKPITMRENLGGEYYKKRRKSKDIEMVEP